MSLLSRHLSTTSFLPQVINTSKRYFSRGKGKKPTSIQRSNALRQEEYQKQQYLRMQEQLAQKEEQRQNQLLMKKNAESQVKITERAMKNTIDIKEPSQVFAQRPDAANDSPAANSDKPFRVRKKINSDEYFSAPGKQLLKSVDVTAKHSGASGHFVDQKDKQFMPSVTKRNEKEPEEGGLTAHDIIFSLNALIDLDFVDVISMNRLNKEIMTGAKVTERIGGLFQAMRKRIGKENEYNEQYVRKLYMAALNIVENHPDQIPAFLRLNPLEDVLRVLPKAHTPAKPTEITHRMMSIALIGSIIHGRPLLSTKMVDDALVGDLFDYLITYQPSNDPAMEEQIINAEHDNAGPTPHTALVGQASETFLEIERAIKIIGTSLPHDSPQLSAAFIPELVEIIKNAIETSPSGLGTMRLLSLCQSLGMFWESVNDAGTLDRLADELLSKSLFPFFLDQLEHSSEANSVIFHRLTVLCMKSDSDGLDLFRRSTYAEKLQKVLSASHDTSRISKNGLFVSVHLACMRSLLERNPMIKYEYVDYNVFTLLVKIVYDNTEFPPPIDPVTGLPVSVLPDDYPFPVISFPMYLSALDLVNLLAYQGSTSDRPLPAGLAARTVGLATSIINLSPQHAYVSLRILLSLADQPLALDGFKHLQTMVSVAAANEKFGGSTSSVRFQAFALAASVYASCPSAFIKETIREDIIPTIVQGVQISSIEIAAHSLTALGRIVALMETKSKTEREGPLFKTPELNNSSIPYRRIIMSTSIFDRLKRIIAETDSQKCPDGLKSLSLRFLTNFFCHPPSLHRDILVNDGLPLYQKIIQDGSPALANASAVYLEMLANNGYFEAIMESSVLDACIHRISAKIPVEVVNEETGEKETVYNPDYSLSDVFRFVTKAGDALVTNAVGAVEYERTVASQPVRKSPAQM